MLFAECGMTKRKIKQRLLKKPKSKEKWWEKKNTPNREKVNSEMVKWESPVSALKRGKSTHQMHSRANESRLFWFTSDWLREWPEIFSAYRKASQDNSDPL